jgi:hypothetical protein
MTMSASKTLIRYLGPSEAYFWLSNQSSWKHFVVAAQITGETTTASWRTALDAVQRRHPLLGVCIDADDSGAPYFRLLPELRIPLPELSATKSATLHAVRRDIDQSETAMQFNSATCRWSIVGTLGGAADIRMSDERRRVLDALANAGEPRASRRLVPLMRNFCCSRSRIEIPHCGEPLTIPANALLSRIPLAGSPHVVRSGASSS